MVIDIKMDMTGHPTECPQCKSNKLTLTVNPAILVVNIKNGNVLKKGAWVRVEDVEGWNAYGYHCDCGWAKSGKELNIK